MEPTIQVRNLTKSYGRISAVNDISFQVFKGDVLGFLGPNGAGKSTTMKMLTGFLTPCAGDIQIAGFSMTDAEVEIKKRIGYLPEGAPMYPDMCVEQFLTFSAEIRHIKPQDIALRIAEVVKKLHLETVLHQTIDTLSKGFKRRVGFAQAIIHDPEILILDEPTDGLDPNQKYEIRQLISSMARDKTILLSTHILEEVEATCNRTIIIAQGELVADSTPAKLSMLSPTHNTLTFGINQKHASKAQEIFCTIADIKKIEIIAEDDAVVYFKLIPNNGTSLLATVSETVKKNGWKIRDLAIDMGKLEEYFREITQSVQTRS